MTLLRRDDMLVVDIDFVNVRRTEAITGGEVLFPANAGAPAFMVVSFPPQAVLEQARAQGEVAPATAGARFSGPSRLAFRFSPGRSIPFTTTGLLSWTGLVNEPDRSAVEYVWDLILHPTEREATWANAAVPITTGAGVTELWHTRLTMDSGEPVPIGDVRSQGFDVPFRSSLTKGDRSEISRAAAMRPLLAHELTLSALGATVDLAGDWADLPQLTMVSYRHQAVLGRDENVLTAKRGFLFPFGFAAQLDVCTERRLGAAGALLEQTIQLTVTVPEVHYDRALGVPFKGRDLPLRRLRLHGPLVTEVSDTDALAEGAFWVNGPTGSRIAFNLTAEDNEGNIVSFRAPAAFVLQSHAFGGLWQAVLGYDQVRQRTPAPASGRICLVPAGGGTDTVFDVTAVYIGARVAEADAATLRAAGQLAALPRLVSVDARVPELEVFDHAARTRIAAGAPTTLDLDPKYVQQGLTQGGIYASLKNPVAFAPPATSVGGVAALGLSVSGLSRATGLVGGDLEKFRNGRFDPAEFLAPHLPGLLPPTLLGFVKLADLVQPATVDDGAATPRVITEFLRPDGGPGRPSTVRSTVTWRPRVKSGLHAKTLRTTLITTLDLRSTTSLDLGGGGTPISHVEGELRSFALEFAGGALVVQFARLAFVSRSGAPPSLDLDVADVRFGGDLRFLDALRRYLPSPSNGPRVTATAGGIEASYTLAIPTLSTGVFLLQNLALSASVTLPLDGRPVRVRFAVSERDDPFLVTVAMFGGGGFIAVEVESDRVVSFEATLEFGAATALNLGIASASVAVTAGVYIRLSGETAVLSGFFRALGELDVLGLLNVSVEVYLALGYRDGPRGSEAYGVAMLTVRVRVLFFSESVTLTIERSFGTGGDPTFEKAFPTPEPWRQRCAAFASMAEAS